jgi:hypothetical protein
VILKYEVYINNPHTKHSLKESLQTVVFSVSQVEHQGGTNTIFVSCDLCWQAKGNNYQHCLNCGKAVNVKVKFSLYMPLTHKGSRCIALLILTMVSRWR